MAVQTTHCGRTPGIAKESTPRLVYPSALRQHDTDRQTRSRQRVVLNLATTALASCGQAARCCSGPGAGAPRPRASRG
eukprot:scaffold131714_cov63-Phaeocystis_antarctica.AAC.3